MLFQAKKGSGSRSPGKVTTTTIFPLPGSLYVMRFPTNQNFKHSIPVQRKKDGRARPRLSVTFRSMRIPAPAVSHK